MNYLGDFKASSTVRIKFTTHAAAGGAVAPSTAFEIADVIVYKDGSATQRTSASGMTMMSPFDSITGLHHVDIDLSDNTDAGFWAAGSDYAVVLSPDTETVDSLVVVKVVATFSIENRCVNWAKVVSPTTTVGLSGTTVKTATDVETDTQDIQGRLPAALGANGNIKADVRDFNGSAGTFASGRPEVNTTHLGGTISPATAGYVGIDWSKINAPSSTVTLSGTTVGIVTLVGTLTTYTGNTVQTGDSYARIGAAGAGLSNITLPSGGLANVTAWTVALTGNITGNLSGSVGSVAGAVGSVTGAVGSVTGLTASDVGAIKAKTDNLPSDPADASDIAASHASLSAKIDAVDDYVDTEVAAIKAKTDNLPASPAAVGSAMTLAADSVTSTALAASAATEIAAAVVAAQGTVTGTVAASPAPATSGFDVTLTVDRATGFFDRSWVGLTSGAGNATWRRVTTHTRVSATVARFAFSGASGEPDAALAATAVPTAADTVTITGRG